MEKAELYACINENAAKYTAVSDAIWNYAELGFEEKESSALLQKTLADEGFAVTAGLAGIETAFKAVYGAGAPRIAILGEFDALPGLSQKACQPKKEPEDGKTNGHGCGHHLLGTAGVAAAVAVKQYLAVSGRSGTIEFYGCPAEENGSGKALMAKAGVFDGLDSAITWHPSCYNVVMAASTLANYRVEYTFTGRASHAAMAPHLGRSALDAVELMNVGANFLREHIIPQARLHYAITDTGGTAPNVVQPRAVVDYMMRAPQLDQVKEIVDRVEKVARGAAMMTETEVEVKLVKTCANVISNPVLEQVLQRNLEETGVPVFSDEDKALATEFIAETPERNFDLVGAIAGREAAMQLAAVPLHEGALPHFGKPMTLPASSDVGDVSWNTPTAQFTTACFAMGTAEHTWQQTAQGKCPAAHKGMLAAARVLAGAAVDLFEDTSLIEQAKERFNGDLAGRTYKQLV